jgi:hypothetical protein
MQLLVFTVVGLIVYLCAYAFGLGGTVAGMLFLLILFTGAALRVAQPLLDRFKP